MLSSHNESEVARIRLAILAEHEAGQRALHDFAAGTARHDIIEAKIQRLGKHFEALTTIVGSKEEAGAIIADTLEDVVEVSYAP